MKQPIKSLTLILAIAIASLALKANGQQAQIVNPASSAVTLNIDVDKLDTASLASVANLIATVAKAKQAGDTLDRNKALSTATNGDDKPNSTFKIEEVYHFSFKSKRLNTMAIGYENYFKVSNFDSFVDEYLDQQGEKTELVLFANGKPFPSVKLFLYDVHNHTISFMVSRADTLTQKFMQSFVSKCMYRIPNPMVGFGIYNKQTGEWDEIARTEIKHFDLLKPYTLWLVVFWFLFLVVFFYTLGKNTNLLKGDTNPDSSYSLALAQFAFWTIIVFTSYFYLWIINFKLEPIPQSTLVLLGITAATTAGSRTIDIKEPSKGSKKTTGKFFNDLLIDGDSGYSVHRAQLFLITLLFGVFYLFEVITQQTLPDFDDSLLWLIGISSGTFVGIKSVEGLKGGSAPAAPSAPAPQSEQATSPTTDNTP